jgi:hypothetical protein
VGEVGCEEKGEGAGMFDREVSTKSMARKQGWAAGARGRDEGR